MKEFKLFRQHGGFGDKHLMTLHLCSEETAIDVFTTIVERLGVEYEAWLKVSDTQDPEEPFASKIFPGLTKIGPTAILCEDGRLLIYTAAGFKNSDEVLGKSPRV